MNKDKWRQYSLLMRLDKPIGTFLLLWPTLWALWIAAEGLPPLWILLVFCLGVFLMRSAGCVINDYADRDFDAHVERTRNRPLAQNRVSPREAMSLFLLLVLIAFALALTLNWFAVSLSFVAIGLAATYPFMKRYTYFPQVILGAAFAWSIPMAFAAIQNEMPLIVWVIYTSTVLWVLAYDTLYGMVDREDDLRLGLKSTAILFGEMDLVMVGVIQALFLTGMYLVGEQLEFGIYYYSSWVVAVLLVAVQMWRCRTRDRQECFNAFLNNNYVGLILFLGIVLHFQFG
ncbi:4-hydroxybenzoate octaprenyltransferase [Kangiella profundi]|uniref:4-hydroxybenzoate octaprenyltransferase n=1 Tax=Kangiella profundi TaxID=1561924 RepID=A0A2K9AYP9_9GAMM|nr:4-hydroxybenzoate octaprenyltransferase [Kangiella profundi]AUD77788.1 4-hydroxybenzoate octaprenyltransferase [Kangiella profundi]